MFHNKKSRLYNSTLAVIKSMSSAVDEGRNEGESRRPPKGKRTVVTKYARHACAQCKKAKAKCEGGKPVCERCQKMGHDCIWTQEDARRPLTRAHEQALKHQNALLRTEVERLTREVSVLRLRITSSTSLARAGSTSSPGLEHIATISDDHVGDMRLAVSSSSLNPPDLVTSSVHDGTHTHDLPSVSNYGTGLRGLLQPDYVSGGIGEDTHSTFMDIVNEDDGDGDGEEEDHDCDVESAFDSDGDSNGSDDDLDDTLDAPTKTLFSEQEDLHMYGLTSVFRLRRRTSQRALPVRSQHFVDSGGSGYDSFSSQDLSSSRNRRKAHQFSRASSQNGLTSAQMQVHKDALRTMPGSKKDRRGKKKTRYSAARSLSPERTQRHVLLTGEVVEDTWKGCECQSDCWNRWLPKGIPLSRREHDVLLDRLFFFLTSWCMRIIPEYFLRDMHTFLHFSLSTSLTHSSSASLRKLAHYSPFLHNSLLALATAFSTDAEVRKLETRMRFAEEAKTYIEDECSWPNISTVQALGILASYYSGQGHQTLGFMYFGMSVRIAQALGLSADCTPLLRAGRLRPQQVFDRAWAFHMSCAQDACWSLYVGRECGISLPSISKRDRNQKDSSTEDNNAFSPKPRDVMAMGDPFCLSTISEGKIGERLDLMSWRGNRGAEDATLVRESKTFTIFLWGCQLMKISRRIIDLMNLLTVSDSGTEIKLAVTEIDIQLNAWRQDLPSDLKLSSNESNSLPSKLMMHAAFWWQLILLHRPFYQRHRAKLVGSSFSVARCNMAAREIICIARLWRKNYGTVRFAPITLIQTIFASGTIYILQATQATMGRRPAVQAQISALDSVEELIGFARECSESWECGTRIADIFDKLLKEQRSAKEGQHGALTKKLKMRRKTSTAKERMVSSAVAAALPPSELLPSTHKISDSGSAETASGIPLPYNANVNQHLIYNSSPSLPYSLTRDQTQSITTETLNPSVINNDPLYSQPSNFSHGEPHYRGMDNAAYRSDCFSDDSYASDSQYTLSADDRDHRMSNSDDLLVGGSSFDFSFLFNAQSTQSSMDAVMLGMGMFDPLGLSGMGLAIDSTATNGSTFDTQALGLHSFGTIGMSDGNTTGLGHGPSNPFPDLDFTSDADRAFYDTFSSLSSSR
ncbi:hypothetical protein EW145_g6655 [Phellinidium pouzarii]|uniref:Zn(2)-C6 fungal-type domain-containing protein n=1 Tax=Phellinidium pouzarii TaxID=167371 RepID=A0A4S4KWG0_9AGAM|nr:hypothetical protein EW145_g6655 [Phellinidium pouzarii]